MDVICIIDGVREIVIDKDKKVVSDNYVVKGKCKFKKYQVRKTINKIDILLTLENKENLPLEGQVLYEDVEYIFYYVEKIYSTSQKLINRNGKILKMLVLDVDKIWGGGLIEDEIKEIGYSFFIEKEKSKRRYI